jgi:3-oxoacyl-[acyl-carrier-protein] synthase II
MQYRFAFLCHQRRGVPSCKYQDARTEKLIHREDPFQWRTVGLAALSNAGLNPDQIQYVNAHGTSTPLGDAAEVRGIKRTFGDHAYNLVVSSTKSMTGHLLGGAGSLEAIFTVLAIHHQVCPPTINIFDQDPDCDLDFCANVARDLKIDYAVKNAFGFGGTNGSVIFAKV